MERNTLMCIFWALGAEEHGVESDDEDHAGRMGDLARKLARGHLGKLDGETWCKLKHAGLSYINSIEQIGKRMRKGEDYDELAKFRDGVSKEINKLVREILKKKKKKKE